MKNKKEKKNNFEKFQGATNKSKGFLKNTFGMLFSCVENISLNPKAKTNDNENISFKENSIKELSNKDVVASKKLDEQGKEKQEKIENKEILFQDYIEKHFQEQDEDINDLKMKFNQASIKDKRSTLIKCIHEFLSKTINIEINAISLNNRTMEILCSTIILNNRLRGIRRIIRKENKDINYINNVEISDERLCIEKASELIEDSIQQIKNLKQEFIMEFYYDMDRYSETEDIMTEFSSIEYQITSKQRELENI